jgi:hypothetical protein
VVESGGESERKTTREGTRDRELHSELPPANRFKANTYLIGAK